MSEKDLVCPVCDESELVAETYAHTFTHRDKEINVAGLERYRCSACGADPVFPAQARRNYARIVDAKR